MSRPTVLVRYIVLGVGFIYSAVLVLAHVKLDNAYKMVLGWMPAIASVCLVVWDAWLWRQRVVQRFTHRPRIDGLWEVTLQPTDESHIPDGGNRGPIRAFIEVRQSYWSLYVHQHTGESGSESKAFFWERPAGCDVSRLAFIYENTPRPEHLGRSPRHRGSCSFETNKLVPTSIQGTYFTDRYTQGEMKLQFIDRTHGYANFVDAQSYVDSRRGNS